MIWLKIPFTLLVDFAGDRHTPERGENGQTVPESINILVCFDDLLLFVQLVVQSKFFLVRKVYPSVI
jgi:hypothetical protein